MINLKTYAGIALTTLTLPLIAHISGISAHFGDRFVDATRREHKNVSELQAEPNNYENHYQKFKPVYHTSAKFGFSGLLGLMTLAGSVNTINTKRKLELIFNDNNGVGN